jgi:hypothetical protein
LGHEASADLITAVKRRIDEYKGLISTFEDQGKVLQAEIEAVKRMTPAEAKDRAENQAALVELALERLELDRTLSDTFKKVRLFLQKRTEITEQILARMRRVEFTLEFDGLDEDRFKAIEAVLSPDLIAKSEQWVRWLLGEEKGEPYTVLDEMLTLPETLASANFYRRGERVELTPETLREVQKTEKTRLDYPSLPIDGGGFRLGERKEIREPRVEKCLEVVG